MSENTMPELTLDPKAAEAHDRNMERYTVYVHKTDWEYAKHLLSKLKNCTFL